MGILESLLNAEWVKDQVMHNSFEFWTWTLAVFFVSAIAAFGIGKWVGKKRMVAAKDAEIQRERERNAEQQRLIEAHSQKLNEKEHEIDRLTTRLVAAEKVSTEKLVAAVIEANRESFQPLTAEDIDEIIAAATDDAEAGQRREQEEADRRVEEHVTRAYNLILMLNKKEAKALLQLVDGGNQLVMTDPGTTGLQSLGAIVFLGETGSYYPPDGHLGYYSVNPIWRTYASWERDLLEERAGLHKEGFDEA